VDETALDIGAILRRAAQTGRCYALNGAQQKALTDLGNCRTPRLGGRIEECSACRQCQFVYNSCRNRHCPKCQAGCRAAWLAREAESLLAVEYHHLVFTLPAALNDLVGDNARLLYGLLFDAASDAVREMAADPKRLGAQVGLTAVLHTWGQNLSLHPHLHIMASGGGLSCNRHGEIDESPCWRPCRPGFFLPVRPLSRLFRGKFLAGLRQALADNAVRLPERLRDSTARQAWLKTLAEKEWVVHSKPPTAGPEVVLRYLARYTYRVAMSNQRLVAVSEDTVRFTWKDYRAAGKQKAMTLPIEEFARRFLQHVLPSGFVRIRHYGLLANRGREGKLAKCRELLAATAAQRIASAVQPAAEAEPHRCRLCGQGVMVVVELLPRPFGEVAAVAEGATPGKVDSS
jgi:Putative transposase/Transposase zinc-binding domain